MDDSMSDKKTMPGSKAPEVGDRNWTELAPGTRLGRYGIVRLLGRGGMGQVYLARHELQKTLHALKILPSEFSGRPVFVERFRNELQTMARLQHPNVVHVQYSDVEGGRYYLVMDFVAVDGTEEPYDLEAALAMEGRLAPEIVRRLMLQLCDGLVHAHGHGVIHRDLKPANVLLTSKDLSAAAVRICDFGLAKMAGEEEVRTLVSQRVKRALGDKSTFVEKRREQRSGTGSVLGTYGYMSPEQEEGRLADARSDLYALGVLLYRMLTGQRLRGLAKSASQLVAGLDPAWDAIIGKCLELDPAARWQTVGELRRVLEALGGRASPRADRDRSQNKVWLGLIVVAAASLLSLVSLKALQSPGGSRATERGGLKSSVEQAVGQEGQMLKRDATQVAPETAMSPSPPPQASVTERSVSAHPTPEAPVISRAPVVPILEPIPTVPAASPPAGLADKSCTLLPDGQVRVIVTGPAPGVANGNRKVVQAAADCYRQWSCELGKPISDQRAFDAIKKLMPEISPVAERGAESLRQYAFLIPKDEHP